MVTIVVLYTTGVAFEKYEGTRQWDKYIANLYHKNLVVDPNIRIVISTEHHHIGGNVWKALQLIELKYPSIQYLYYAQHDFEFAVLVDHMALIDVMYKNNDDVGDDDNDNKQVNYIMFQYTETNKIYIQLNCEGEHKIMVVPRNNTSRTTRTTTTLSNNDNENKNKNDEKAITDRSPPTTLPPLPLEGSVLCKFCKYSDNNHLVRFD